MGIFDNVILHSDLEIDGYPHDPFQCDDGRWKWWQTKDLNPSMDLYMVRPVSQGGERFELARRHPPVFKWTHTNEGLLDEDADPVEDADHWRQTRFTGTMNLVTVDDDKRSYTLVAEFEMGILTDIWVDSFGHYVNEDIPDEYEDLSITPPDRQKATPLDIEAADWYPTGMCPDCGAEFDSWPGDDGDVFECEECDASFVFSSVTYLQRTDRH